MFLAASTYFYSRFESDEWTATHYQPSILTVSTLTNLGTVYAFARIQKHVSYPWRITLSLLINCFVFTLLAFSTIVMKDSSVRAYFGFLMVMVFGASFAAGLNQNGVFAYVAGYGREEYTQAIMGGQGVAGVLPCIAQIVSVLAVPREQSGGQAQDGVQGSSSKSAFIYFFTATGVSVLTLLAFLYLLRNRPNPKKKATDDDEDTPLADGAADKSVSLWTLFKKLRYLSLAVFVCLQVTMMFFPVYTSRILSVNDPAASRMYHASVFIPLAFLFWNIGDLSGRLAVAHPGFSLAHRPRLAFVLTVARFIFVPLYLLCNINGTGAIVKSDFFYLFVVQLLFGATNGYLASSCMMGASFWVSADEREAAGGFMSMMLIAGLAAGSFLSFIVAS
jgi:equilibrative nucleoside transporter 1/2/3